MRRPRSRTVAVLRKELIHIRRDVRSLLIAVFMPVALLLIYGYGVSSDVRNIRLMVVDWSRTLESRELADAFVRSGYFRLVAQSDRYAAAGRSLDTGQARVVLTIPRSFARHLARGEACSVQLLIDGSDSTTATVAAAYAESILASRSQALQQQWAARQGLRAAGAMPRLDARVRVWYNEDLRSTNFIIPGLIAIILAMTAALLTSGTIAGERERGTIEQLVASPITSGELIIGKLGAYCLLALADVALVLLVGTLWFRVPLRGSVLLLMASAFVFLIAALGMGLFFSARLSTMQTALTAAILSTMVPSILLSGFYFPIRSMPPVLQLLTAIIPARYFMVITRGVFLKGVGLDVLWPQLAALGALAGLVLIAATRSFRKKL